MSREVSTKVMVLVRNELLRLARFEDALAAAEAGAVPYWASYPHTVRRHRMAAVALRAHAAAVAADLGGDVLSSRATVSGAPMAPRRGEDEPSSGPTAV